MKELVEIIIYSLFAGLTVFFGGLIAWVFEKHSKKTIESYIIHWTIALGGGILIAAVAFVLTPKGIESFSIPVFSAIFFSGAVVFFLVDKLIESKGGFLAQTLAMLLDFVPEAIALGAIFVHNHNLGKLLALFIGLQNLPESFNAYFDLRKNKHSSQNIIRLFFIISFLGVFCAFVGKFFLSAHIKVANGIMLFCAGGILYLVFQDIAPLSKMKRHWEPALGAAIGFIIGMIGTKIFG
jgi:ZIP family zinc transporter